MSGRVTFADLPLELSEAIILLAARAWAIDDKASVAALSRTSRAVHALVQPILVETVVITASNLSSICAASRPFFRTTRRLIVDAGPGLDAAARRACERSFPALEMFSGSLPELYTVLEWSRPFYVVMNDNMNLLYKLFGFDDLSRMTRLRTNTAIFMDYSESVSQNWPSLSHLMLDIHDTIPASMCAEELRRMVAELLTLPKLERLCFRLVAYRTAQILPYLEQVARGFQETRLYVDMEDAKPAALEPQTTFDNEHWLVGKQLFTGE